MSKIIKKTVQSHKPAPMAPTSVAQEVSPSVVTKARTSIDGFSNKPGEAGPIAKTATSSASAQLLRAQELAGPKRTQIQAQGIFAGMTSADEVKAHIESLPDWQWMLGSLAHVQKELSEGFGVDTLYIGAGSARAILDNFFFDTPLEMRDLDVMINAKRPVTKELADQMGKRLEDPKLGEFSSKDLRKRPRSNPALPVPERHQYNAGFGFFFKKDENIFDLSVFHSDDDLALNGIFDFDRVLIPLHKDQNLADVVSQQMVGKNFTELVKAGVVGGDTEGYINWVKQKPQIRNWAAIEADTANIGFRALRNFGKLGVFSLDAATHKELAVLVQNQDNPAHTLQQVRGLMKIFGDTIAPEELHMAVNVGLFDRWRPEVAAALGKSAAAIAKVIGKGSELERLENVIDALPSRKRLGFLDDVRSSTAAVDPSWTMEKVRPTLNELVADLLGVKGVSETLDISAFATDTAFEVSFLEELHRVSTSETLSEAERKGLMVRAFLRRSEINKHDALLDVLAPGASDEQRAFHKEQALTLRVATFTGVLNPLHLGHKATLQAAIRNGVFDRVHVLPTPATTHNENPIAWESRLEMANAGLADVVEAEVIDQSFKSVFETTGTGGAIAHVSKDYEGVDVNWFRLMGNDSFERFEKRGFLEGALDKGEQIYVSARDGHAPQNAPEGVRAFVSNSPRYSEDRRSSTVVRELREAGKGIDALVPRSVAHYIETHDLYATSDD